MANEQNTTTTTAATTSADTTTETQQPKFMTAEDFNGAMTARERRFEERIAKQMASQLEKFMSARQAPVDNAADDTTDDGTDAGAQQAQVEQPKRLSGSDLAIKKAAAKIDALTKQMAAKEEAAAKEKAELLQRQEKADMIAALAAAGVTTAKGAYATLKEDGRIRRNADGELVMVVVKDYAGTKAEEEVPIAAGIKEWLGTDDGKCFLPPRGGGEGSGTVVRGGATRTGAKLSKEEAKREAQVALTKFVLGG
jgi:excinuclease UvrABC ATPase subunit